MALRLGVFVVPTAGPGVLEQIVAADQAGLDVVAVQDHPYQRRYFDTWTLLAFAAARTNRVVLLPDVLCLPLRPPAMVAKAAASLDVLSGGRVEIGLGAGAFWPAIAAMGGPQLTAKESVDGVEEAVGILRDFWDMRPTVRRRGERYDVHGARPGPAPAHRIGIWVGAYGPRMLRLTGSSANGWLPSLGERFEDQGGVKGLRARQQAVDEAALAAGRDPADVARGINVLDPPDDPVALVGQLVDLVALGFRTLLVAVPDVDPDGFIRRLGHEVAPAVHAESS